MVAKRRDFGLHSSSSFELIAQACVLLDQATAELAEASNGLFSAAEAIRNQGKPVRTTRLKGNLRFTSPLHPANDAVATSISKSRPQQSRGKKQKMKGPTISPYFLQPPSNQQPEKPTRKSKKAAAGPKTSPFFPEPPSLDPTPSGLSFVLEQPKFGLIQERICGSLYSLVVQAILWNKTTGRAAQPILWTLLTSYPTPETLAEANVTEIEEMIRALGLQKRRAQRLVDMAKAWVTAPPCPERRYGRREYPRPLGNRQVKKYELLAPDDEREGWEIGHLPGVGEYALDSFRLFGRDRLRGISEDDEVEPEWKRVVPSDKELGPYVKWKWAQEGWIYDLATGKKSKMEL